MVRHTASDELDLVAGPVAEQAPALRRWAETTAVPAADPPVREFPLSVSGLRILASPIPTRRGFGGFVALVGGEAQLDQLARLAASRAASACAIDLDRERAVLETQERLEGEFVASLLTGSYASESAATERAARLGLDFGAAPALVFAVRGPALDVATLDDAARGGRTLLERRGVPALLTVHDHALCGVLQVSGGDDEAALRHVEMVRGEASAGRGPAAAAGVGRAVSGVAAIRSSYREAEQALALGRRVFGEGRTVRFADLGLHRLLVAMAQHAELGDFYEETVGTLVAYDDRTGGELMRTLEAYFACHGSPTDTAHRLRLHRNTILYRLRRIEEVGHLRLDDPSTRLNLQLCLRVRDVLPGAERRRAVAGRA
ncbi:MAG: helix-turn-helix domain-containing protein [Candidatus Dormibacteraeota bacterium]|nr:helix-turn-helix domain-containing protein [Candidatus Dormibacteraeota bacterium]